MAPMTPKHEPVMAAEILDLFALRAGAVVVDGTVGLAGHSELFAKAITPGGTLVGFDWDASMLARAGERLSAIRNVRIELIHDDYRMMAVELDRLALSPDAILMDLGLNSAQIDDPERGLSFLQSGPLDMRMDRSRGEPASALLNRLSPSEIEQILFDLGDERWARAIAKKIVERRSENPLRTTTDLVEAVLAAVPPGARDKRIHPATRSFQAVRIAVNGELEGLEEAILGAAETLKKGGTIAVISFHSGEDRAAKTAFRALVQAGGFEDRIRKPLQATPDEVARNPRSRSAKLRAVRRLAS